MLHPGAEDELADAEAWLRVRGVAVVCRERTGWTPAEATVRRWYTHGRRGARLRVCKVGGVARFKPEWVRQFFTSWT